MLTRKNMRAISALVLTSFTGSLASPIFAAEGAAQPSPVVDKMVVGSQRALNDLWFLWADHLKSFTGSKAAMSPGYAADFFKAQGASNAQIDVLVNNARATGQLSVGMPSAAEAAGGWFDKIKAMFKKPAPVVVAETAAVQAGAQPTSQLPTGGQSAPQSGAAGLSAKVKSFFSRFTGGAKASTQSGSQFPTPGSMTGGGGTDLSSIGTVQQGAIPSALGSAVDKVQGVAQHVGRGVTNVADKVALGAKRGAHAVGSTVKTGYLTAKYAIDPRPYFEIPIYGDTVLKVRSTHQSTVAFKEGKWVTQDFSYKSSFPSKGDLATRVDSMGQASAPTGFFGKITQKFNDLLGNVKARMRGEAHITPETKMEIQRLEVTNQLVDQARTISDAQRALKVRIDQLKHESASLRRPLDVQKVDAMEQQYRSLEKTKESLLKKASGTMDSPASSVVKDAAKWALYSVGITASINLIRQAFSGEGIDIGAAFSFVTQPSFWGGTAGGFLGSTLLSALATSFMPPGVGIFFKVLPGFLGAALGFDFGSSLFGGQMDLMGTLVSTLASAGGYSLAWTLLGGAAAPGIALIGAAIAAGSLAGFLLDKFRGDPDSEGYVLPDNPVGGAQGAPPAGQAGVGTQQPAASADPALAANLAAAQAQVDQQYNAYVNYLKARDIKNATLAHQAYMQATKQLELAKTNMAKGQ